MPRCFVPAAPRRLRLLGADGFVVGELQGLLRRPLVVARVVGEPGHRGVRELVGLDVVAPPDLGRIDADLRGELVHRALDGEGRLWSTGAAVGVGRRHGGEDRRAREHVGGHVVDAAVEERAEQRDARRDQLEVGAHVGQEVDPDAEELAVGVGRQLDVLDLAAPVDGALRVLGALLDPSHRPAVLLGQRQHEQLVGVDVELRTEPAADRRRDHPHLLLGEAERDRRHHLEDVWDLGGGVERDVAAERLGHRRTGAGLHRHRDQALLHVALLHHVRRVGEGPIDRVVVEVELPRVGDVRAEVVVDDRGVGEGVLEVGDRRQRVVLDLDGLERVACRGGRLGDHHRHAVADVADLVDRERVVGRVLHVLGDRPGAGHRAGPRVHEVGAGVGGDDAGQRQGGLHVDRGDAGVGVGAAQDRHVQRARDVEVVGEAGLAGEQGRVLPAPHPGADDRGGRRSVGDRHAGTPFEQDSTAATMFW